MERLAGRTILLWGWRRSLVAFLAGALAVLIQAPFDFFAAGFVAFPVLVWLLDGATAASPVGFIRRLMPAFSVGCWFGFGYCLAGMWWIGSAMLVDAEAFAWALPLGIVGVPFLLCFHFGIATVIARLLWSNDIGRIAALAFGLGLGEWLRGFILLGGFPWNPIGLAALPTPLLMQSVALTGVTGMNALAVFVFAMPAMLVGRRHRSVGALLAVALIAAHAGYGYLRLDRPQPPPEKTLAVRIVQPSIDLSEKWDASVRDRVFATMLDLSRRPVEPGKTAPQLILWPETAIPFLFSERPDALVAIGDLLQPGQMLLTGAVRAESNPAVGGDPLYYNSILAIDDSGEIVDAVDKVHLVPFGEYLPFADVLERFGLTQLVAGPMNFGAGASRHALKLPGGLAALPLICYEIIFPQQASTDQLSADLIINVTNDAWFGDTPGPYQHFRQAQIRAVENGAPVLRAANNGISGIIDARGQVADALVINARGIVDFDVRISTPGQLSGLQPRVIGVLIVLLFGVGAAAMRLRLRP
jgi:apolipoprotein N-acyltransferase